MNRGRSYDVCTAVISDLEFDARVWKEVHSLSAHGFTVLLHGCHYGRHPAGIRAPANVELTQVSLGVRTGRRSLLARAIALVTVSGRVMRSRARVYHAHNIHTGPACWLASRLRRARFVFDAHEIYGEGPEGDAKALAGLAIQPALQRFLVRRSAATLTTNEARKRVLARIASASRILVLGNVPRRVDPLDPLDPGFPKGRRVLLYQGGIYARARPFRQCLQALAMLEDFDLVVIGFGRESELALIRGWAAELGLAPRVHLLPPRPFTELVRTAAGATVGLVPIAAFDLGAYLGDTNKLHEYLMAGLPVAASDLPEIRRVLSQGRPPVGELFDARSPESIAAAVRLVVADSDMYQARRREARRLALERYNWEVCEPQLVGLYADLLSRPAASPRATGSAPG